MISPLLKAIRVRIPRAESVGHLCGLPGNEHSTPSCCWSMLPTCSRLFALRRVGRRLYVKVKRRFRGAYYATSCDR